jgi:hypothetical protein
MSVDRYCSTCGSAHESADRFCARCGQSLVAPTHPLFATSPVATMHAVPDQLTTNGKAVLASNVAVPVDLAHSPFWASPQTVTRERDWTHPGLAFALVSLTFGLYSYYWLFNTWRQIKRYDGDEGKRPLGHTLAMLVPIYGLFRMHAHMRTIVELVRSFGGHTTLSPGTCVVLWIVVLGLTRESSQPKLGLLFLVYALIAGALVAWGQAALNQAWSLNDPEARVRPTHPFTWVILGIGVIATALAFIGLAS